MKTGSHAGTGGSDGVHAPYNFVPLARFVLVPEWAARISQDVPFSDAVCGELEIEVEATTPICVGGGRQGNAVVPFRTPDGTYAIPGSSIKGMLRNVLEIATFSKFQFVDRSRRYAVRDLQNRPLYIDHLTNTVAERTYEPKSRTGWLTEKNGQWWIQPCHVSRVEQGDLLNFVGQSREGPLRDCFTERGSLVKKYEAWQAAGRKTEISFNPGSVSDHRMSSEKGHLRFSLAGQLGKGQETGTIVFTGQPSPNKRLAAGENKGKHREFIFYGNAGQPLQVDERVRRDFELNHSEEQGEQHGGQARPNEEWSFWKRRLERGERVPVFYLLAEDGSGRIRCMGLAQMFRLAYKHTLGDAIDNSSPLHNADPGGGQAPALDFADAMFGYTRSHASGGEGARGRVHVGLFLSQQTGGALVQHEAILNGPKPTYYPAYVEQPERDGSGRRLKKDKAYSTLMDDGVRLRGWKRYPVRARNTDPPRPAQDQQKVTTRWKALPKGTCFRGSIQVHNLREIELGALLWAMDFGGRENCRHALGLAKPFGFGAVRVVVRNHGLRRVAGGPAPDLSAVRARFVEYMKERVPNWEQSEQIVQLLAMADPAEAGHHDLSYMTLGKGKNANEFVNAKKAGEVLPRYKADNPGRLVQLAGSAPQPKVPSTPGPHGHPGPVRPAVAQPTPPSLSTDPAEAVRALFPAIVNLRPSDQADHLLRRKHEVHPQMKGSPAAWAKGVRAAFPAAIEEIRRRAARSGTAELEEARTDLSRHEAACPDDPQASKKWTRELEQLKRRVRQKEKEKGGIDQNAENARQFLKWLDSLDPDAAST